MAKAVLSKLLAFVSRTEAEVCEQCGGALSSERQPLLEPEARRVVRVCSSCAALLSGQKSGARYLRVERSAVRLADFELPESVWADLEVPVGLVFFRVRGRTGEVVATFPGRAGLIEAFVPLRAWQELESLNPCLRALRPDVEALLIRRTARHRDYFQVSIDYGYELSGLLRSVAASSVSPELSVVQSFIQRLENGPIDSATD